MKKYSEFFQTLHDEEGPTGHLGRGTHYSILRSITWQDDKFRKLEKACFHDFAVIWDEDHDERVIQAIESLYCEGLLSGAIAVGERKGSLTLVLSRHAFSSFKEGEIECYQKRAESVCGQQLDGDWWPVNLDSIDNPEYIVNDEVGKVAQYIGTLDMLWHLGQKAVGRKQLPDGRLNSTTIVPA